MIHYIADTHFGHKRVIEYDKRPFSDIEEMDQTLIANWNQKVGKDDQVYILGDFAYRSSCDPSYYLKLLNGHKYLIIGDRDKITVESQSAYKYLDGIERQQHIKDGNRNIILSHFPIAEWNAMKRGSYHVFGHIHAQKHDSYRFMFTRENALNAGCMINHFSPATLDELIENNKAFQSSQEQLLYENLKGKYLPLYLPDKDCWGVDTWHGVEIGCMEYVLEEFCFDGVLFHHTNFKDSFQNHEHGYECILRNIIEDPESFSIEGFEGEYSIQERRFIMNIQNTIQIVKKLGRPLYKQELIENREKFQRIILESEQRKNGK